MFQALKDRRLAKLAAGALQPRLQSAHRLPEAWPRDARRAFMTGQTCPKCGGRGAVGGYHGEDNDWEDDSWTCSDCRACGWVPGTERLLAEPASADSAAFTRAASAAPEAEELARSVARALQPWGSPAPERVAWRIGGPLRSALLPVDAGRRLLSDLLLRAWSASLQDCEPANWGALLGRGAALAALADDARLQARFEGAAKKGLEVPTSYQHFVSTVDLSQHPLLGRSLAEFSNPFTPLLEIWALGYALDSIEAEHVLLYCPRLPPDA
jgi:hypothetical protein